MDNNFSVQILSIDAKDLYSMNILGKDYSTKWKDGNKNEHVDFKKYINTLDYSLDLIKLREFHFKEYRRHTFGFRNKNKKTTHVDKEYTNQIVNVTFNYSYKAYNRASKDVFVKAGFYIKDVALSDSICIKDGEVIAIAINRKTDADKLSGINHKYFRFNAERNVYEQYRCFKTLVNTSGLRHYLYENGFSMDGLEYVRYKRSSGSARVGKCLFINKKLYDRVHKWELCGLRVVDGQEIDLAAFEAAISLSLSSIVDTIEINPENILVINDYKSCFKDEVINVMLEDNELKSAPDSVTIKNDIWDGQSLLDKSMFEQKYTNNGMLLLRNRFFKTCAFNSNIQKWFADNNITSVSQLNGYTLADDISQIKMITTPNSIKYTKFGSLLRWLKNIDSTFGIVKYDKPTGYFNGRMVQTHYQLLNSLQMSNDEMKEFLQPSLDYISKVANDPAVLRYHIKYGHPNLDDINYTCMNDIVYALIGSSEGFSCTRVYLDFKKDLVKSMIRNLRYGHVLVRGTYSTLFGNGIEMLKSAIGKFDGTPSISPGNIYCRFFDDGVTVLGCRSPHINSGNVYLTKNTYVCDVDNYFNLSNEIVYVNSIRENLHQRLNGADYDGDTMLLTDNALLINSAKANYNKFLVPTSSVESAKILRKYIPDQQADLDVKTSINKIGEIVNLSQELNSRLWNEFVNSNDINVNLDLYYDICKLAVLSGIEIDKAKKESPVNSQKEIDIIKSKYLLYDKSGKSIKPMFFKCITQENGYKLSANNKYEYLDTPMDYLHKLIKKYCYYNKTKTVSAIPLYNIISTVGENRTYGEFYNEVNRIVADLRYFNSAFNRIYCGIECKDDRTSSAFALKCLRDEYINSLEVGKTTAFMLLKLIDNCDYGDIKKQIFRILFSNKNLSLFKMIQENSTPVEELIECSDSDIQLYDFDFFKYKVQNLQKID